MPTATKTPESGYVNELRAKFEALSKDGLALNDGLADLDDDALEARIEEIDLNTKALNDLDAQIVKLVDNAKARDKRYEPTGKTEDDGAAIGQFDLENFQTPGHLVVAAFEEQRAKGLDLMDAASELHGHRMAFAQRDVRIAENIVTQTQVPTQATQLFGIQPERAAGYFYDLLPIVGTNGNQVQWNEGTSGETTSSMYTTPGTASQQQTPVTIARTATPTDFSILTKMDQFLSAYRADAIDYVNIRLSLEYMRQASLAFAYVQNSLASFIGLNAANMTGNGLIAKTYSIGTGTKAVNAAKAIASAYVDLQKQAPGMVTVAMNRQLIQDLVEYLPSGTGLFPYQTAAGGLRIPGMAGSMFRAIDVGFETEANGKAQANLMDFGMNASTLMHGMTVVTMTERFRDERAIGVQLEGKHCPRWESRFAIARVGAVT